MKIIRQLFSIKSMSLLLILEVIPFALLSTGLLSNSSDWSGGAGRIASYIIVAAVLFAGIPLLSFLVSLHFGDIIS